MIEAATPADYAAIGELNVAAYAEFAPFLAPGGWDTMQRNLRDVVARAASADFLVAREAGVLVGSVACGRPGSGDPAIFAPGMASVLLLAVHPAHRGRGLARELTEACVAKARAGGASAIGLFTSERMLSAQRLYERLGFVRDAELPRRHGLRYFRYVLSLT